MYILLADDTEDGFHTDSDWEPLLHEYQQVTAVQYVQDDNDRHHGLCIILGVQPKKMIVNISAGLAC